jgi:hypothetical protein
MIGAASSIVIENCREFDVGLDDVTPDTSMLDKVNLARVKKVESESASTAQQLLQLQHAQRKLCPGCSGRMNRIYLSYLASRF